MLSCKEHESSLELYFSGPLTIYQACDIADQLSKINWQKQQLSIDLSATSEIDTSGVQLLMMVEKSCRESKCHIKITHSNASQQIFELMNINEHLPS